MDFILQAWFMVGSVAGGLFVRNWPLAGIIVAFTSVAALVKQTHYLDGASSGRLAVGMLWVIGSWIAVNYKKMLPGSFSVGRQLAILVSVVSWLYACLEWRGSPQVHSLTATSHAHIDVYLSVAAVSTGLTAVIIRVATLLGVLPDRDRSMFQCVIATALVFGGAFAVNALALLDFFGRHGDSMAWAVPMLDYFFSWFYLCSVFVATVVALKKSEHIHASDSSHGVAP